MIEVEGFVFEEYWDLLDPDDTLYFKPVEKIQIDSESYGRWSHRQTQVIQSTKTAKFYRVSWYMANTEHQIVDPETFIELVFPVAEIVTIYKKAIPDD